MTQRLLSLAVAVIEAMYGLSLYARAKSIGARAGANALIDVLIASVPFFAGLYLIWFPDHAAKAAERYQSPLAKYGVYSNRPEINRWILIFCGWCNLSISASILWFSWSLYR